MIFGMMVQIMSGSLGHYTVSSTTQHRFNLMSTCVLWTFPLSTSQGCVTALRKQDVVFRLNGRAATGGDLLRNLRYQRMRHKVSDKIPMRSTGSVNLLYHQTIKGRERRVATGFGEMNRDGLLRHFARV